MNQVSIGVLAFALVVSAVGSSAAADWPTHLNNNQRNAATDESLALPLAQAWVHRAAHAPSPAWPPPAKQDFYHSGRPLTARQAFDQANGVVAAGDSVYYGSSADGQVVALSAESGKVRWSFFTEGPVRLAPTIHDEKVLFGSDDGWVYCVTAANGKLVWKYRPGPEDRRLSGNGRMISRWPIRSGVLIAGDVAYVCAGMFPAEGVYLCAVDAASGKEVGKRRVRISAQGHMLSDRQRLFIPTGRSGPACFDLITGRDRHVGLHEGSGTYLVACAGKLVFQKNRYGRAMGIESAQYTHSADYLVSSGDITYFHSRFEVAAMKFKDYAAMQDRRLYLARAISTLNHEDGENTTARIDAMTKERRLLKEKLEAAIVWRRKLPSKNLRNEGIASYSLIMAGDVLFSGRDGKVVALSTKDGSELWSGSTSGKVYSMAVAQGRLLVATDDGTVHAFVPGRGRSLADVDLRRPAQSSRAHPVADKIVGATTDRDGYCLVLDTGDADLAIEIAARTQFQVVAAESDIAGLSKIRLAVDAAGYGTRIAVHHLQGNDLPYSRYCANLVVVGRDTKIAPSAVARVLRPFGGVVVMADGGSPRAWLGDAVPPGARYAEDGRLQRGALPGAGAWTHLYADPGNTACSGDALVANETELIWFGGPGPQQMIDRHNRTSAPLFLEGRVFVPANERILAIDAYNGTQLWSADVPGSRRVGALKDSGHMVVDEKHVYIVVKNQCWPFDVRTGRRTRVMNLPHGTEGHDWGYLAVVDGKIVGTYQPSRASFNRHTDMCAILEGDFRHVVVSKGIFAVDTATGKTLWSYPAAAIFNSAVAVGDGRVYLLASQNESPKKPKHPGRMRVDHVLAGGISLVALDLNTGRKLWERSRALPHQHILYLCYTKGTVLLTGSYNHRSGKSSKVRYGLQAFAGETGRPLWERHFATEHDSGGTHGEQWQHPAIIGDAIYTRSYACRLDTGAPLADWKLGGGGCGTLSASQSSLYLRRGRPVAFDVQERRGTILNDVSRPGCFINMIPAGGILSIPEASAGCSCTDYPIQTSFGYAPKVSTEK